MIIAVAVNVVVNVAVNVAVAVAINVAVVVNVVVDVVLNVAVNVVLNVAVIKSASCHFDKKPLHFIMMCKILKLVADCSLLIADC